MRQGLVRDVTVLGALNAMDAKVDAVLKAGGGGGGNGGEKWERMLRRYVLGGGIPSYSPTSQSPSANDEERENHALSRTLSAYLLRHNVPFPIFLTTLKALSISSTSRSLDALASTTPGEVEGGGVRERKKRILEEGMRHIVHMTGMQMQMGVSPSSHSSSHSSTHHSHSQHHSSAGHSTTQSQSVSRSTSLSQDQFHSSRSHTTTTTTAALSRNHSATSQHSLSNDPSTSSTSAKSLSTSTATNTNTISAGGGGGGGASGTGGGVGGWSKRSLEDVLRVWGLPSPPLPPGADVREESMGQGEGEGEDDEFGYVRRAGDVLSRGSGSAS